MLAEKENQNKYSFFHLLIFIHLLASRHSTKQTQVYDRKPTTKNNAKRRRYEKTNAVNKKSDYKKPILDGYDAHRRKLVSSPIHKQFL